MSVHAEEKPTDLDDLLKIGVAGIELPLHPRTRGDTDEKTSEDRINDDVFRTMMSRHEKFFIKPILSKPTIPLKDLQALLDEINQMEAGNHRMRRDILIQILDTPFLTMRGPVAGMVMRLINGEENPSSSELETCLSPMMDLLEEIMNRIPGFRNTFQTMVTLTGLMDMIPEDTLPLDIRKRLDKLKYLLLDPDTIERKIKEPDKPWSTDSSYLNEPIVPKVEDLLDKELDEKYKNVIEEPYQSTKHYIETWFRLMQEDFLSPLRKAIGEYKTLFTPEETVNQGVTLDDGYHYCFTKILDTERIQGETVYLMEFSLEGLWHVDWEETDRLKPGSLLALSDDHFETAQYALVSHNEDKPAKAGKVWISTLDDTRPTITKYLHGIEPMAFFEPYRCVLKRLKQHGARCELGAPFPYEKYFVYCDNDVQPPLYMPVGTEIIAHQVKRLVQNTIRIPYLLRPTMKTTTIVEKKCCRTGSVTDYGFNMDESQLEAINHALTHELAIIQGPPGCGKSFIGAQLVNILMLNANLWRTQENGCILMIAFTNHAIDQFIQDCEKSGTDMSGTVRIGSRGDQATAKYQLRNKRQKLRDHFITRERMREHREMYEEISELSSLIKETLRKTEQPWSEMEPPVEFLAATAVLQFDRKYAIPRSGELFLYGFNTTMRYVTKEQRDWWRVAFSSWLNGLDWVDHAASISDLNAIEPASDEERIWFSRALFHIDIDDRKRLYAAWCEMAKTQLKEELAGLMAKKNSLCDALHRSQQQLDIETVRLCNIVAMTTTGASKHAHLAEAVKPTIVVIEEAAEVLESHIVSPLTLGCKHMIMIGDHQQLRPGISEHEMEKRNLSISLFERLVRNEFPNCQLKTQRRMHPDISSLLVPHIYPALRNHPVVDSYPKIQGIAKRMVFLEHEHYEQQSGEKSSKQNDFEARYLSILCRYLLLQGYSEKDITIICTYAGQVKLVKKYIDELTVTHPDPLYTYKEKMTMLKEEFQDLEEFMAKRHTYMTDKMKKWYEQRREEYEKRKEKLHLPRSKIADVLVKTVDNYQGEENKIILLSFVRSNKDGNIGFLKWPNRICVALSRAKHGFYAVGNFKLFAKNTKSDLWKKLCLQMKQQEDSCLRDKLPIVCQNHGKIREVSDGPSLLEAAENGGCKEVCGKLLGCGHKCTLMCHYYDSSHTTSFVCRAPCTGRLDCGHACSKVCKDPSDDKLFFRQSATGVYKKCSKCSKKVNCQIRTKILRSCGHMYEGPCALSNEACIEFDIMKMKCGHDQRILCHQKSEQTRKICRRMVTERLPCGHPITRVCHERAECKEVVQHQMKCGHYTEIKCATKTSMELSEELTCTETLSDTLSCGHTVTRKCGKEAICREIVEHRMDCGHLKIVQCHMTKKPEDMKTLCEKLMWTTLECGHDILRRCQEDVICEQCS